MFDAYPMISSRTRRIQPFTGTISPAKNSISYVAYLIRQGQQVVVEEDGGDRHLIILVAIPYSEL